jgi:hypothetical protein
VFQVYRCYRSDASLLSDLVRCQIVFGELCDMHSFMKVHRQEGMRHTATFVCDLLFKAHTITRNSECLKNAGFSMFSE